MTSNKSMPGHIVLYNGQVLPYFHAAVEVEESRELLCRFSYQQYFPGIVGRDPNMGRINLELETAKFHIAPRRDFDKLFAGKAKIENDDFQAWLPKVNRTNEVPQSLENVLLHAVTIARSKSLPCVSRASQVGSSWPTGHKAVALGSTFLLQV